MKKVLVGIPSYTGDAHARLVLLAALGNLRGNFDVLFIWNGEDQWGLDDYEVVDFKPKPHESGHEILAKKENILRDRMLWGRYSHLLSLESDNIPRPDTVEKLLSHNKDIISAPYLIRAQQEFGAPLRDMPMAMASGRKHGFDEDSFTYFARNEVIPCVWGLYMSSLGGMEAPQEMSRLWTLEDLIDAQQYKVIPIAATGLGCTLISRKVLSKIKFINSEEYMAKYHVENVKTHTDHLFFAEAKQYGFQAFLDPNHMIKHLHKGMADERTKWFGPNEMHTEEIGPYDKYKAAV